MADYYSIITNRGKELEAEALASGRLIVLTHFVVGDSNGKQVKPDPSQIRLINETYRGDIAELVVSPEQSTQLMAKIVLPTGVGGFTVREVGLMTDAGELYAVANCPSIDKPVGGVSVNMQFRLAVSDTSNITLNVATGDGLFLRIDQNLKEIKARGSEAQKTSRESIGVLDGTTQQRGLVQLNSAVNSTSETQAATPAAVKIAMDNANARLAKDRNGGDIPNVALFLQNLGLVETINRAAGALQKDQNLSDIPDKTKARAALQLGTAATATLTTSTTDDATGRVLTVGYQGIGGNAGPLTKGDFNQLSPSGFISGQTNGPINPTLYMGFNVRHANAYQFTLVGRQQRYFAQCCEAGAFKGWDEFYTTAHKPTAADVGAVDKTGDKMTGDLTLADGKSLKSDSGHLIRFSKDSDGYIQIGDNVNTIHIGGTAAGEVTIYSGKGINLQHTVNTNRYFNVKSAYGAGSYASQYNVLAPYYNEFNSNATSEYHPLWKQKDLSNKFMWSGGVLVNADDFVIHYMSEDGKISGQFYFKKDGTFVPTNFANFDARYQPKGSYTPAGQAYTKAESDARYVQNIRVSAPQERKFWDGAGWSSNDSAFATAIWMVGGSSNVGALYVRYIQKNINGTWINVTA
ncbi:phage tail protein [Citrobacter braakii]